MKILHNRTLYRCEYCTKHRLTRAAAQRHELFCRHNPSNKHKCFGCEHLVVSQQAAAVGAEGQLQHAGRQSFTCAKFGKDMYTYVAERRNIVEKLGEVERMPLTCKGYEPEEYYPTNHPEETPF
jgi:hypothetical protein